MTGDREPFLTEQDRKTLVAFRPWAWRTAWESEPTATKAIIAFMLLLAVVGAVLMLVGNESGTAMLIGACCALSVPFVVAALWLIYVGVRWSFYVTGLTNVWRRIRDRVWAFVAFAFWTTVVISLLVGLWPYMSLSPTRSWYAISHSVDASNFQIGKEPHDCEFMTAPIGEKHCHYEAQFEKYKMSDAADAKSGLYVTFERITE